MSEIKRNGHGAMDMTQGSPTRLIVLFSLPLLAGNVLQQLYNMVDSVVVGNYVGSSALTAVGAGFSIMFLISSLFLGFSMGATIMIAQYVGAGDQGAVGRTVDTIYSALLVIIVPLTLLGVRVVLVHGGGPAINKMLARVGKESKFVGGLRYTDEETMGIVQQVLAGQVNKDLVALLKGRGVGLCGMDGHMIMCKRKSDVDLGYVGEIEKVNTTLIDHLLADSFIPVIATVGMDDNGVPYNINADTAAAEIAIALHAEKLVSMTDIVGLLYDKNDESTLIPEVEVSEIEGYKAAGVIAGGMLPKIEGMADAIYQGVHEAVIIDGRVPHSILLEMFSDRGAGTMFYRRGNR